MPKKIQKQKFLSINENWNKEIIKCLAWQSMEPPVGFEPTTYGLQNRCSNQLS